MSAAILLPTLQAVKPRFRKSNGKSQMTKQTQSWGSGCPLLDLMQTSSLHHCMVGEDLGFLLDSYSETQPRQHLAERGGISVARTLFSFEIRNALDLPGGAVDRKSPASSEDRGSIPGLKRSHMQQSS